MIAFVKINIFFVFWKKRIISNNYQKPIAAPFYEEKKYIWLPIIDIYK